MIAPPVSRRTFLFLQGPHGECFSRLGATLSAAGHGVRRINFNGGDRGAWDGPAYDYRGTLADWPATFADYVAREGVTDLILYGDCRPLHAAAHQAAKTLGVHTHVFEEGYIRPNWVTLELDGVNGHSTLPRDPQWYLEQARGLPPFSPGPGVASSFDRRTREAIQYYADALLQLWRFPHYRSHRPESLVAEIAGWARRWWTKGREHERSDCTEAEIAGRPFFLLPLQLNSDHQIRVHSPFADVPDALAVAVESFAAHAPADTLLVIKRHPLDNGLIDWRRLVRDLAARNGVGARVHFLAYGDLDSLVEQAIGVVTVNSTVGTLALGVGRPVYVMGTAVYDMPGITHQGPLQGFWSDPQPPDPAVYDAFRRVLLDRCLIEGGFLSDQGLDTLLANAAERLTHLGPLTASKTRAG